MATIGERTELLPRAVESFIEARTAEAVFVVSPDYRIVHWDARAESLTGLLSEEMIGKPCYEVVQGECEGGNSFSAHICSAMRLVQEEEQPVPGYDLHLLTRSGGKRWVNVTTLIVEAEEGPYLVHLLRDSQKAHDTLQMAQELIRLASSRGAPTTPERKDIPALTPRQLEVLKLLSEGRSAKEIGQELYLSQATIRNHVRSLLQALGAHSQLEALAQARRLGLLSG